MIDIRKLKELVRLMVANELTELDLRDSEEQVTLRRGGGNVVSVLPPAAAMPAAPPAVPAAAANGNVAGHGVAATDEEEGLARITSPMVGTYYAAPNPDAGPFVTVGSSVEPESVVCMMEAMKIFNEIKAEISGTIEKIMVKNGDPVEFGQPLFLVKPH